MFKGQFVQSKETQKQNVKGNIVSSTMRIEVMCSLRL